MNTTYGLARRMTSAEACLMAIEFETILITLGWPLSDLESGDLVAFPRQALDQCPGCGRQAVMGDGPAFCDQGGQA